MTILKLKLIQIIVSSIDEIENEVVCIPYEKLEGDTFYGLRFWLRDLNSKEKTFLAAILGLSFWQLENRDILEIIE